MLHLYTCICSLRDFETGAQLNMTGRRKKVHAREQFNAIVEKHNTYTEIIFGYHFSEKELKTESVQKWLHVTGKEGVRLKKI